MSVAFGPEGQIAAGYSVGVGDAAAWCSSMPRGERLRPTPLGVKEGAAKRHRAVVFGAARRPTASRARRVENERRLRRGR